MTAKNEYEKLCNEITEKVKSQGSSSYSKSDLVSMTQSLLNTPEHVVDVYVKNKDGEPSVLPTKPVEKYRESLKPVLKQFGIDKDELNKVHEVQFTKDHAEALSSLAGIIVKDYTKTGRKLKFPITSPTEGEMSLSQTDVVEKTVATRKIVQKDNGEYESVPTGKTVTTKAHNALRAGNKVPGWLKVEV